MVHQQWIGLGSEKKISWWLKHVKKMGPIPLSSKQWRYSPTNEGVQHIIWFPVSLDIHCIYNTYIYIYIIIQQRSLTKPDLIIYIYYNVFYTFPNYWSAACLLWAVRDLATGNGSMEPQMLRLVPMTIANCQWHGPLWQLPQFVYWDVYGNM